MKTLILLLALVVPFYSQVKPIEVVQKQISEFPDTKYFSVKYDKFKGVTDVFVRIDLTPKKVDIFQNITFNIIIASRFTGNGIPEHSIEQTLCVSSTSKDWRFLKNRELNLLVDASRMPLGNGTHDGDVETYFVSEVLCWPITEQQRNSILNAEQVEFQLGSLESAIGKDKLLLFKQYQKLLLPAVVDSKVTFTLSDARGKRKVFVETSDEQSELKILKILGEKKFEPVNKIENADLVIRFGVESTDFFTLGSASTVRKWGKMSVYLRSDGKEGLIFTKNKKPGMFGQLLHNQAAGFTEDFVKALLKIEDSR
jgi:hypothetical protein